MSTRFQLRICGLAFLAATAALPAQAAVTVIGGGMARDCYLAVEGKRTPPSVALDVCDLALEQENLRRRDRAATHVNRGILHLREGRNERALVDFERSLGMEPDLLEAKVNLGAALYGLGRYDEAMAALNEGIASESQSARAVAYYNRALIHEKRGDLQSSYEDFVMALEVDPTFLEAARQIERFIVETAPAAS